MDVLCSHFGFVTPFGDLFVTCVSRWFVTLIIRVVVPVVSRLVVVTFRVVFSISCLRVLFILALAVVAVRAWSYLFRVGPCYRSRLAYCPSRVLAVVAVFVFVTKYNSSYFKPGQCVLY